jgi:arylamine N-acetyltransferase
LSGVGGLCYNLNTAGYFLLKAIGFKVTIALCNVTSTVRGHNNHVVVYVEDVEKPGDKFLVEMGLGLPTFRAINLDFEKESPHFVDSFLEYKYIRYEDKLVRMHRMDDHDKNQIQESSFDGLHFVIDGWRRFYDTIDGSSNNLEEIYPWFDKVI